MSEGAVKAVARPVEAASNGVYQSPLAGIASVMDDAKRAAAGSVNAAMTAAYWQDLVAAFPLPWSAYVRLPDEALLVAEIDRARDALGARNGRPGAKRG